MPTCQGSASQLIINGQQFPINASSRPITTTQDVRSPNIKAILQDAAVGSAAAAGISGITGNRTITPGKVIGGAAAGATIGGIIDPTSTNQVVVINPNSDLTLTLNSDFSR